MKIKTNTVVTVKPSQWDEPIKVLVTKVIDNQFFLGKKCTKKTGLPRSTEQETVYEICLICN